MKKLISWFAGFLHGTTLSWVGDEAFESGVQNAHTFWSESVFLVR